MIPDGYGESIIDKLRKEWILDIAAIFGVPADVLMIDEIPAKLTRPRKARKRRMSMWRYQKTARHITRGGVGVVGKLRKRAR